MNQIPSTRCVNAYEPGDEPRLDAGLKEREIADAAFEAGQLIASAHAAFVVVAAVPPPTRAAWLRAVACSLEERAAALVALAHEETHLGEPRLRGELSRTAFQLDLLAEEIVRGHPLEVSIDHVDDAWGMGPRPDLRRMNVPLGVVGVFGASNFPFAFGVAGNDTASALAAGCSVVFKAPSGHPRLAAATAGIVEDALAEAGAPPGLLAVVFRREAGNAIVDHPLVQAIGFTGSTEGGRALFDRAAARERPIPFFGELGSINPVVVAPGAWGTRRAEILAGFIASVTSSMGQLCTKPGVLFVPRTSWKEISQDLAALPLTEEPRTQMLTGGLATAFQGVLDGLRHHPGVTSIMSGVEGEALAPSILGVDADTVLSDPRLIRTELFGPASVIVGYERQSQLLLALEAMEGQLTGTIHANADDDVSQIVGLLAVRAGRVVWNSWPTGVTVTYAQQHGGPYPSSTMPSTTSVGTGSITRFMRAVTYQSFPDHALPLAVREANPLDLTRRIDGIWETPTTGAPAIGHAVDTARAPDSGQS